MPQDVAKEPTAKARQHAQYGETDRVHLLPPGDEATEDGIAEDSGQVEHPEDLADALTGHAARHPSHALDARSRRVLLRRDDSPSSTAYPRPPPGARAPIRSPWGPGSKPTAPVDCVARPPGVAGERVSRS